MNPILEDMTQSPDEVCVQVLTKENTKLTNDLKITENLLDSYRKCLLIFNTNCCCDKNVENKSKLDSLEQFYYQYISSKNKTQNEPQNDLKNSDISIKTDQLFAGNFKFDFIFKTVETTTITKGELEEDGCDSDEDSYNSSGEESADNIQNSTLIENGVQNSCVCSYDGCGKHFEDNYHLRRHIMRRHSYDKPFECQNCDKSFSRSDHLVGHVNRRHHNYKKYVCTHENCDFETIFEDKFKSHESRFHVICRHCEQTFDSKYDLKLHKQKEHKTEPKVRQTVKRGPKTARLSVKSEQLDEKTGREVPQGVGPISGKCFTKFKRKKQTLNATDLKTKLKKYEAQKEIFCPEEGCGKQFKCLQNLRKHTKTVHLNLRPFPCDWPGCESAFKTREAMTNHKSIHSNERNFKCDFDGCNKSFKIRCKLTQHLRCHGIGPKNERFPCSWPACGQYCASEQALTEHLNRHQNIRPFVCQFNGCEKSYFTSFELRQHSMKFHEQNESFRCDYRDCTMSYLNKRDLAKHRRLHIDVAKFVCSWPECCHTFNTSRDLSDHMNRHMDIKANKCLFHGCDRSYFTKKDLMRHVKQSHS